MLKKRGSQFGSKINLKIIRPPNRSGQVTVFIILAIAIVAGIFLFVSLRKGEVEKIPSDFRPVENYFLDCIKEYGEAGASLLGEHGGYIYFPEFIPGDDYTLTSNQLDFFGSGIPYWYYPSGKNIIKEQVPSKVEMEKQLEKYIEENLFCDFEKFFQEGYEINLSKIKANAEILDNKVKISVKSDLILGFGDEKTKIEAHEAEVDTKLGKFYGLALEIYSQEKQRSFIEDYAVDVLRLYAPVSGVELTCSPKVWFLDKIKGELKEAFEANMIMIKTRGDYYTLKNKQNKYFITDVDSTEAVRFLYSKNWPAKINVDESENGVLIAEPVGNQEGLGILGFCYVPYHFVYDITYPLLIQIYDEKEVFQFPVAIIIEANQKRNSLPYTALQEDKVELCKYKNTEIGVFTYNTRFEPVEADIRFKCLNEGCEIGKTKLQEGDAYLQEKFPQCVNGFVIAKAEGYETKKSMVSTNQETSVDIFLDRLYNLSLSLEVDGKETQDMAIIYFKSDDTNAAAVWPEQKEIKLSEGAYNITVYVYRNSSIKLSGSSTEKCVQVSKPGLLGLFGQKKEQCFNLNIPSQEISSVIIGGAKNKENYVPESALEESNKIIVKVEGLPVPRTLEELQNNYNLIEDKSVDLEFVK